MRVGGTHNVGRKRVCPTTEEADSADVERDHPVEKWVAIHVGVALGDGVHKLPERNPVAAKAVRVGLDLVALNRAAAATNVEDAG